MALSCLRMTGIPTPVALGVGAKFAPRDMTCVVLVGRRGSGNSLVRKELARNKNLALQALFSLPRGPRPAQELPRKFRSLGLPPLFPALQVGRIRGWGLRVHLVMCPGRLPPLPLGLGRPRGGGVSGFASVAHERASVSSAPSGAGEGEVACSRRTPPAHAASSVASPRSSHHAPRRDESREVSEDRSLARSSRVSRSSERGTPKDRRARSRSDSSCDRGRRPRSRSSSRSRSEAVIFSVAVLPQAVAIFGPLPLSARALWFSGRPVSILGSIPVF